MKNKIDDTDLNEMLFMTMLFKQCGFNVVKCDTDTQIELLTELVELRRLREIVRTAYGY